MTDVAESQHASPAFGERWGRHWLDVARFGESTGSSRNLPYPHAWRYRDYVIDSFNADKPFQQFVQEQLAGDLLPANTPAQKTEQLIATGFLALGVKDVNQRFEVRYVMDNVDEQIDTVSRSFLGLTVSCARCHDHKFDPVPTADYYALAGIFKSTEPCDGLRNQMGGGGLAYYVPDRVIPLEGTSHKNPKADAQIKAAQQAALAARESFTTFRDEVKPENAGPERDAKLKELRQTWQTRQAEVIALTDPAQQRGDRGRSRHARERRSGGLGELDSGHLRVRGVPLFEMTRTCPCFNRRTQQTHDTRKARCLPIETLLTSRRFRGGKC